VIAVNQLSKKVVTAIRNIDEKALISLGKIMDGNNEKLDLLCCFCNQGIVSSKVNPPI